MLREISETIVEVVSYIPALFVPRDSVHFVLARGIFGILLVVLVIIILAFKPLRAAIKRYRGNRRHIPIDSKAARYSSRVARYSLSAARLNGAQHGCKHDSFCSDDLRCRRKSPWRRFDAGEVMIRFQSCVGSSTGR